MTDFLTLAKTRPATTQATTLTIELSGLTLYLSDRAITISGVHYQPYVKAWGNLTYEADGEAGGAKTSDFDFTLADKKIMSQAAGKKLSHLFKDYDFIGVKVTMTQRLLGADGSWYSRTCFVGRIEGYEFVMEGRLPCIAFTAKTGFYDVWLPPTKFRKEDTGMSRLPDDTVGTVIPIVLGDWWDNNDLCNPELLENVGITRNVVPVLLYDPFDDTTYSHNYRACSHRCHTVQDSSADGVFLFEKDIDTLCSLELGLDSIVNNDNYVDVKLTRPIYAEAFIRPDSGSYTDWQKACDRDETTYFTVTPSQASFHYMAPCPDLGIISEITVQALVEQTVTADGNAEIGFWSNWNNGMGSSEATAYALVNDTPTFVSRVISQSAMQTWQLIDGGGFALHIFTDYASGTTTGSFRLYEICVRVKYIPKALKGVKEAMLKTGKRRSEPRHLWGR